jgi:hypothetical protein
MLKRKILNFGVVGLVALASFGYWWWIRTPAYSLKQLVSSIRDHDRDAVEKYLDFESVADCFIEEMMSDGGKKDVKISAGERMIAHGLFQLFKPVAKNAFFSFVETGNLAVSGAMPEAMGNLSKKLKKMADSVVFSGIPSARREGKLAFVRLVVRGGDKPESFIEIRMKDRGDHWQVVGIDHLIEVL